MAIDPSTESQGSAPQNSGLYDTPPPELVERAEHARKELETLGATVRFEAKWWGFEVHLNQAAVDAYLEIKDLLADILGEALKEPLSTLVTLAAMAQKVWVQAVSRGYGCKLVSPWISPTMLIPIGINPSEDPNLWWTVFGRSADTGHFQWKEDTMFPAHASAANPAAAVFNGRLILVHRGFDDQQLWWTSFDPDNGWSVDTEFGAHSSAAGPALAVYDGKLHCVHKGASSDSTLWHTTFTSSGGWTQDTPLPRHSTASNPALAVYGNTLHMVHRGSGNDTSLWHTTYTSAEGWGTDNKFRAHSSLEGPGLAVFDNRLYCVHRGHGNGDQNLWWTSYKPGSGPWTDDQKFPGHTSGAGPAVVVYRDKNGTQDQLMVIHRGYGKRAAGTDSAEVQAQIAAEEDAS